MANGKRGRPPKPTALKKLEGNPGKRALNDSEPVSIPLSPKTKPPKWLDPIAKKEWKRILPELCRMGLATRCDTASLEAYCDAYSTMVRAAAVLNQEGFVFTTNTGYISQLPQVNIKNQAANLIRQFGSEFGLTPSSRCRLKIGGEKKEEEDPMEAILAGKIPDFKVINGGKA
jgi:P27 family predicted phage terminase small subunit